MRSTQVHGTMPLMTRIATIAVLVLLLGVATGCDGDKPDAQGTVTDGVPTMDGTMSTAVYLLRDGKVSAVRRTIAATLDPERSALTRLLDGPTDDEAAGGLASAIPKGTELLDFSLADGLATVDLDGTFDDGGGSASMLGRVAQVVATLTRYPTVSRVAFRIDGEPVEAIGGEGVLVDPPLGRRAIEGQTPQILIESPLPWDQVRSPIRLEGTANVFEATVSIEVRDGTGTVVLEAFTTATSGTGTRGTFDTTLTLPTASGTMTIVAFESSAKDGRPIHATDVQVTVAG